MATIAPGAAASTAACTVSQGLSLLPSEYFARQCHIGASFLPPRDCARRQEIGVDRIMWGSDYPHVEGSHPYTREHLRLTFAGVPEGAENLAARARRWEKREPSKERSG